MITDAHMPGLKITVADAGIQVQVSADLTTRLRNQLPGDFAVFIVQVAERHGLPAVDGTGFHAGRYITAIDTVDAERAALHGSLSPW